MSWYSSFGVGESGRATRIEGEGDGAAVGAEELAHSDVVDDDDEEDVDDGADVAGVVDDVEGVVEELVAAGVDSAAADAADEVVTEAESGVAVEPVVVVVVDGCASVSLLDVDVDGSGSLVVVDAPDVLDSVVVGVAAAPTDVDCVAGTTVAVAVAVAVVVGVVRRGVSGTNCK